MVQFVCMTRSDASEVMDVFIMSYQNYKEAMELAPKCKFYTLSEYSVTLTKVSRSTFKKKLYDYSKQRENGVKQDGLPGQMCLHC